MCSRSTRESTGPRGAIRRFAETAYRDAILDAAERLFLRVGFHEAKMADVAEEAGIAVGTVYKHFASKDEVFASLLDRSRRAALDVVERALAAPDPLERIRGFVDGMFELTERHGPIIALCVELGASVEGGLRLRCNDRDEHFDRALARLETAFRDAADSGRIRDDIDPGTLAAALAGAMKGTLLEWVRHSQSYSLVSRARPLFDLFMQGARAR
ncbi:MAG TPA: helix-turn-helix domain-containing protein [Polyangiaceae bacterium]|nr:helix-turn-helix domain-containing protein [Polyangiaceae bacterium]